jgi:predicted flap endonuclease-1-like 5' DNA nuclease
MGAFVLGVLVGWLAEWLFYTFFIKGRDTADCAALKSELEEKNREISTLQGKLKSSASASNASKAEAIASTSASVSPAKSNENSEVKKATSTKKTAPVTKSKAATGTKSATVKKPVAKKTTSKKSASSKTKAAPKAKAAGKGKAKTGGDDFTKLSGIGPSMSATLKELGIDTFSKLAATDDDILRDMLEASGARMNNNKEAMDSWNEQATLAAKGDFATLKKMQEAMKK